MNFTGQNFSEKEEQARNKMEEYRVKFRVNRKWLTDEMARDLAPLRLLIGLSPGEMGDILGVSESAYKNMEAGKKELTWDQYLALLFLFSYNSRTAAVTDSLGLYPESLHIRLRKGTVVDTFD